MKDYLEDTVDEKYYINNDKADKLIQNLIDNGSISVERETVDLSIKDPRRKEIANCIKARYDAGISNLKSDGTGVCEPTGYRYKNE